MTRNRAATRQGCRFTWRIGALLISVWTCTGCIATKLIRWAHEEVKFRNLCPDSDEITYISAYEERFPWPGNTLGIRVYFWVKNLESWEDGLYYLRIPRDWDCSAPMDFRSEPGGAFEPVKPIETTIERSKWSEKEGQRWGAGDRDSLLFELVRNPVRAEREDWQPELKSGIYGLLSHSKVENGSRFHSYEIYGYHQGLGGWVKIRTLSLGPGTQWPYRRWVSIPLAVLAFPIDFPVYFLTVLFHPGLPGPEDLY